MLEECAALTALRAADHLAGTDEQIPRREMQKAQRAREGLLLGALLWKRRNLQGLQGRGNDIVHPAEPRIQALPVRPCGHRQPISYFEMMNQGRTTGGTTDIRQTGQERVSNPQ